MNARDYYLNLEAKKGFKDWTVDGLKFLLKDKKQLSAFVGKKATEAYSKIK